MKRSVLLLVGVLQKRCLADENFNVINETSINVAFVGSVMLSELTILEIHYKKDWLIHVMAS